MVEEKIVPRGRSKSKLAVEEDDDDDDAKPEEEDDDDDEEEAERPKRGAKKTPNKGKKGKGSRGGSKAPEMDDGMEE